MRLASIKFKGYRRFLHETTLKTSSKLTVIIGPNEAGKSSVLKLFTFLDEDKKFSPSDRYKFVEDVKIEVCATFQLEFEDYEVINSKSPQYYKLWKEDDGSVFHDLEPNVSRPKEHRAAFKVKIKKAVGSRLFREHFDSAKHDLREIERLANDFDLSPETYSDDQIAFLDEVRSQCDELEHRKLPKYLINLPWEIDEFLKIERLTHPNDAALEAIERRIPKFIEFTDKDRELQPSYNMTSYKHEKRESRREPCRALVNLCEISGLDLDRLKEHLKADKSDRIQKQIDNANVKLKALFDDAWSQSDISIYLSWQKPEIKIMVQMNGHNELEYNLIDERSDGFRQYVALLAFIIKQDAHRPILLIDEAEQHLHYDAQADLVQTFTERRLASQVIYSTHSAGCLPEDLGLGVKLVIPDNDGTEFATSRIENNFWASEMLGFSPLLYGMGAQTLAFFPTRKAVVTEGQSEMLLMPTIFRQVSDQEFNGFQIVPGLASVPNGKLASLSSQGAQVSYILDNDKAGRDYYKNLKGMGVPESRLFYISGAGKSAVTVEDWIADDVFAEAIENYQLRYFPNVALPVKGFFDGDGKAEKIKSFEKRAGVSISKTVLAYIILELAERIPRRNIYNEKYKNMILTIRSDILASFVQGSGAAVV